MINLQRRLKCCGFCHNCSSAVFELLIIAAFWPAENWRRDCKRREGETGNTGSKYCNLCYVVYSWFFKLVGKLFASHHPTMLMLLHCEANDFKQSLGHSTATFIHSFIHFWHAPLWVRTAKRRHHSPELAILSHVNCFVQGEVQWFQVLLGSLHPRSMGASRWSPPVLQGGSCYDLLGIWFVWHSHIVAEQ